MPGTAGAVKVGKPRILFFDLLRITAIFLVVLAHVLFYVNGPSLDFSIPGLYVFSPGRAGVTLFLIVSGCVLEYSRNALRAHGDDKRFMLKRIIRVYPAYWCSLVFSIVLNIAYFLVLGKNRLGSLTPWDYLLYFSGFQAFFGTWGGVVNEVGWFIGLIMCLYLLYPPISRMFEKNLPGTLAVLCAVSVAAQILARYYLDPAGIYFTAQWFPLCRLFEFGFGVFLVKAGLYPTAATRSRLIRTLSDISFYVFLIHLQLLYLFKVNALFFVPATLVVAYLFSILDGRIKDFLSGLLAGRIGVNTKSSI